MYLAATEYLLREWQSRPYQHFYEYHSSEVANILSEFGKDKTTISVLLRLEDRGIVREALAKVINRITDLSLLRWVARKKNLFYEDKELIETIAGRLDILRAPEIRDPLRPLSLSPWQKRTELTGIIIAIMLLSGLEGILSSDQFQSTFDKFLEVSLQAWVIAHPTLVTIIRTGIFAAIGGLIGLSIAIISDRLLKAKKANHEFQNNKSIN